MSYLLLDHTERERYTWLAADVLRAVSKEHSPLVFRGMSGMLVAPRLGQLTMRPLLCVRKTIDDCHGSRFEASLGCYNENIRSYIIVDDFVASGHTVRALVEDILNFRPEWRLEGVLLYKDHSLSEVRDKLLAVLDGEDNFWIASGYYKQYIPSGSREISRLSVRVNRWDETSKFYHD